MHGKNPISSEFRKGRYHLAVSMIEEVKPRSILDIGCGEGHFLSYISGFFPDARLYGCDRCEDWVNKAKKACPNAEIQAGEFMDLELKPADLVVALEVMEHNEDPGKMVEKAASLAGKGGHMLVSIPRPELLRWRVIWWLWTHTVGRWGLGEHTNLTEAQLIHFAEQAGMSLKKRSRFFLGCISTMLFEVG